MLKNYSTSPIFALLRKFWVLVLLLVFCGLFFFSTLIYRLNSNFVSCTLLFPSASSEYQNQQFSNLYAEQRKIPIPQVLPDNWSEEERKIYYLAKELLYGPGPGVIRSYPFVPSGTRLNNLAMQGQDLYIDFSASLVQGKSEHYFSTDAMLALIEKVLRLNFQQLQGIYFTVEGLDLATFQQVQQQLQQQQEHELKQS